MRWRPRARGAFVTVLFVLLSLARTAQSEERVALVIGNSNYLAAPALANPVNDATDLAAAFDRLGFDVTVEVDLDAAGMNAALLEFSRKAREADMAMLFYAGHGLEIDNQNYLVPVDAELFHADDIAFEAVRLEQLLRAVDGAETLRLVLLDACRDNPFRYQVTAGTRSLGRGLARVEPPGGVLVGYAARGGTVAYDGQERNSPYTAALLRHIEEPGLEIGKLFRKVRDNVYRETGGLQEPFTYGSLPSQDIYLAGIVRDPVQIAFEAANANGSIAAWDRFLEEHGDAPAQTGLLVAARKLREAAIEDARDGPVPVVLPEMLTSEEEEAALGLKQPSRQQVQRNLASLGYQPGVDDGVFGPRTREAVAAFQKANGLEDTGFLTTKTVARLRDVYASAPPSLDGRWRLSLLRQPRPGTQIYDDHKGLLNMMGHVEFEVAGRQVTAKSDVNLSNAPRPSPPDLRAHLTRYGRLEMSVVVNYLHFENNARRVLASIDLPDRVLVGKEFDIPGSNLDGNFRFVGRLRRLSAEQ